MVKNCSGLYDASSIFLLVLDQHVEIYRIAKDQYPNSPQPQAVKTLEPLRRGV